MSRDRDFELDAIFEDDPELQGFAEVLRAMPHHRAEPDPAFRSDLRRRLMREVWRMQEEGARPWYRRMLSPPRVAWGAAMASLLLIAFTIVVFSSHGTSGQQVVVASPMANMQTVGLAQPIELQFNQPMDRKATQGAVHIEPATQVTYEWRSESRLLITPVNGRLAPGTRYQVTVSQTAQTVTGQALPEPKHVTFVTVQTTPPPVQPTSTPTPRPSSSGSGLMLTGARKLGLVGPLPAVWSADGSQLYVIDPLGQLLAYPSGDGAPRTIAPGGVRLVAIGPAGPTYARGQDLIYNGQTLAGANPLALGFSGSTLLYVKGQKVLQADGTGIASLNEQPSVASFAPGGTRLAYLGQSGLHIVDLSSSGGDQLVAPGGAAGSWSADGATYAYPTGTGLALVGGSTPSLSTQGGATSLSWSHDGQILLAAPGGLYIVPAAGGATHQLGAAGITEPLWSPTEGMTLAYKQGGNEWIAQVTSGSQQSATQENVIASFMSAREAQNAAAAGQFLDDAGQAAFQSLTLIYGNDRKLSRHQVLLDQPGRVVVRLIIDQGSQEWGIDETLVLHRDTEGRLLVHGATDAAPRQMNRGPEVIGVQVSATAVQVTFDSNLDQSTTSAVNVAAISGVTSYDDGSRTVTISLDQPLDPSATYRLQIPGSVRDMAGRPAAPLTLTFLGGASGNTGPSPSPAATASPSPSPSTGTSIQGG